MTRDQALYFLEGLTAGIASPSPELAKWLFYRLAMAHELIPPEFETVRAEINGLLDEAETEVERRFNLKLVMGRVRG